MPFAAGERAIKESMVGFFDAQWNPRGCGLLVDSEHVVTCAHVIALMITGAKPDQATPPTEAIRVMPWHTGHENAIHASVFIWKPVMKKSPLDQVEDIAVLKLDRPAPDGAVPHAFVLATDWAGRDYMVHGIPESNHRGDWADGKFKGETLGGWVQLLSANGDDLQIDHGFSGAGVWDEQLRGFAGIMVASKKRGGQLKPASYMIPTTILKRAWDDLPVIQAAENSIGRSESITSRDRYYAQGENVAPEFVDAVLRALNRRDVGRTITKESTAAFLDTVASDAKILAELWVELLGLYRQGVSTTEMPVDYQEKLRKASHNQFGTFGELKVFYHHIARVFGDEHGKELNSSFMKSLALVTEYRSAARRFLNPRLEAFHVKDWNDSDGAIQVNTLEDAVAAMNQEAGHLAGLAKVYRATM